MKVKVQVSIEHDGEGEPVMADVACFERAELNPATLGLTLEEGKTLLAVVQQTLVMAQVAAHVEEHRHCPHCGSPYRLKGQHTLTMRWTKRGAHDILQVRVQVLDGEWRRTYERWYPGMSMRAECRAVEERRAA